MTASSIIDDVANWKLRPHILALAGEGEIALEQLRRIACGSASSLDVEELSEHWTRTLIDLLERGRIRRLERRESGRVLFVFATELPDADQAWWHAFDAAEV